MIEEVTIELNEVEAAIESVIQGCHEEFSVVIQAYHVQVRAMIGAQIADKHNADDIAQQTFVFAFQNIKDYKPGTNFLAWLRAIARNKVLTHIRKCSSSNKKLQSIKQDILTRSTELVDQGEFERRLNALSNCVDKLGEEQRDFLQKVNHRESTLEELAESLGKTGVAVRKQASRLYAKLRECIQKKLKAGESS